MAHAVYGVPVDGAGHGDPWTGGVQEAVQQIRQAQDSSG